MNILLLWPPNPDYCVLNENFSCCEPLSLEYMAAAVEDEHLVEIIDLRFGYNLQEVLEENDYDIVGLAVPYITSVNKCNEILKLITVLDKKIIKIVGGHVPTISPACLSFDYINYAVIGEGVLAFKNLVNTVRNKGDIQEVKGIAIINNGKMIYTEKNDIINLDDYPFPARHLTSVNSSKYFHAHYKPVSLMRFSAGCPFNCSFCILWKMYDGKYIVRQNEFLIEEMLQIKNKNIYVIDDEAFINIKKMQKLAEMLISNKIKKCFHMYIRSDTVVNNPELIETWAEAGLDSVLIGLESVFDEELKDYNKNISLDIAYKCVDILHKNNVEIRANFIIKPDYTKEKFERVRQVVFDLDIDRPTFAVLTPFIGTDIYKEVKDQFIIDKPEFFDCYHTFLPTKLSLKDFYNEFANLFVAANNRSHNDKEVKVFYSGKGDSFNGFVEKIRKSYHYYSV